jgi:RNA polymerase sigma factor (sigma-70 family)
MTTSHASTSSVASSAPAVDLARYRTLRRRGTTIARSFRLNEADAEDVVQDALVRMLRVPSEGEGAPRRYESYFDSTVRHLCIDLLRRRGRETEMPEPDDLPGQTRSERHEQRMLVREVLAGMPTSARSILVKSHIEGRTLSEISGELGISANACSAMLYRARRAFRDRYVRSHVLPTADEQCAAVRALMVDTTLSASSEHEVTVRNHRRTCEDCESQYAFLLSARTAAAVALAPGALAAATSGGLLGLVGLGGGRAARAGSSGGSGVGTVGAVAVIAVASVVAVVASAITLTQGGGDLDASAGADRSTSDAAADPTDSAVPPASSPSPAPSDLPSVEPDDAVVPFVPVSPSPTVATPGQRPSVLSTPRPSAPAVAPAPDGSSDVQQQESTRQTSEPAAPTAPVDPSPTGSGEPVDPEPTDEPTGSEPTEFDGDVTGAATSTAGDDYPVLVTARDRTLDGVAVTVERIGSLPESDGSDETATTPVPASARSAVPQVVAPTALACTLADLADGCLLGTLQPGTTGTATVPGALLAETGEYAVTVAATGRLPHTLTLLVSEPPEVPEPAVVLDAGPFATSVTGTLTGVPADAVVTFAAECVDGVGIDGLLCWRNDGRTPYLGTPRPWGAGLIDVGDGEGTLTRTGDRFEIPVLTLENGILARNHRVALTLTVQNPDGSLSPLGPVLLTIDQPAP